jgi:hypothetical protein
MYEDEQDDPTLASAKQRYVLRRIYPNKSDEYIMNVSRLQASQDIQHHAANWRGYPATTYQEKFLRNWCEWTEHMSCGEASDRIAAIKARIAKLTPEEVSLAITHAQHNPRKWPRN